MCRFDLAVAYDCALLPGADRKNGGVRRIDDGIEFLDPVHAEVGYRAGPTLIFMWRQLARARTRGKILHLVGDDGKRFLLRLAHHRRDQPAGYRDCDPDVETLVPEHGAFGPGHVGVRDALERERKRLDDEIVDRNLVGRLAVLVLRRGGVDLLARRHELTDIALEREIEMRDGKLRFEEAPRDHLADIVVRDGVV